MDRRPPLIERLKTRATTVQPDKSAPTISKIIEVRSFIVEQRRRGLSWAALTRLLDDEGVSLAEGTLRNYARMIWGAESALYASGNLTPTDAEIHAALHVHHGPLVAPDLVRMAPQKASAPSVNTASQKNPPRQDLASRSRPAHHSIIRNPDRDL